MVSQDSDDRRILELLADLNGLANQAADETDYTAYLKLRTRFFSLKSALKTLQDQYRQDHGVDAPGPFDPVWPSFSGEIPPGPPAPEEPKEPEEPAEEEPVEVPPWETPDALALAAEIERLSAQANQLRDQAVSALRRLDFEELHREYTMLRYSEIPPIVSDYRTRFLATYMPPAIGDWPEYTGPDSTDTLEDLERRLELMIGQAESFVRLAPIMTDVNQYNEASTNYNRIISIEIPKILSEIRTRFNADYPEPSIAEFPGYVEPVEPPDVWGPGILNWISSKYIGEEAGITLAWGWIQEQIETHVGGFISTITDTLVGMGATAPPRAVSEGEEKYRAEIQAASRLATLGMTSMLGLVSMALVGETIGFRKRFGLSQISAILWDATSFKLITGVFIGSFAWATIRQPLTYNINALLRPNMPDLRDVSDAFAKREITEPEFDQAMAYYGIPDDWIDVYHRYIWKDPRLNEVIRIAEIAKVTATPDPKAIEWFKRIDREDWINEDWWYTLKFAKAGYDDIDVPVLVEVAKMAVTRREQTLFLTQIRRLSREGFIGTDRARELLESAWVPKSPVEFRLAGIALEREYVVMSQVVSMLLMSMDRELITEAEASEQMIDMGMSGDIVGMDIMRHKLGLVARAPTRRVEQDVIEVTDLDIYEEDES